MANEATPYWLGMAGLWAGAIAGAAGVLQQPRPPEWHEVAAAGTALACMAIITALPYVTVRGRA